MLEKFRRLTNLLIVCLVAKDTVMALEALAEFASMIHGPSDERNLQVTIATDSVQYDFLPVTLDNSVLVQSYEVYTVTAFV